MKAVDTNLLQLLRKSHRFVVPIYQRVYSWGEEECEQLWQDILRAGGRDSLANHFTGSIVYIERDQGTTTAQEPDLIIDGQQRVTTVTLLLAALAAHLERLPETEQEPYPGFAPRKIRGLYLTNEYEIDDAYYKLTLSKRDHDVLKAVVRNKAIPESDSRVATNYAFFEDKLANANLNLVHICRGLDKLVVVDVKLTRGTDDPQLVFESMNSTGKKLSQADLIRNFVLMDLPTKQQTDLYEDYWFPMEKEFLGENESRFDEFVRHFLTVQTNTIPRIHEIYDAFKQYAFNEEEKGVSRERLVHDLSTNATWFAAMALGKEKNPSLRTRFAEIDLLASVAYPFQLRLYRDYDAGLLSVEQFAAIEDILISYLFRRSVCRIPTNSLNKTFASLAQAIDTDNYVESIGVRLLTLPDYRRFPGDEEFDEALRTTDLYNFKRRSYLFRKLENFNHKEPISIAEYTIEHIMPQNANRSWQTALGKNWRADHERLLHTLGNLTLTGYNPEYSDRSFDKKRDMKGGFRESKLQLNKGLEHLETWNAESIEARARKLATDALKIWPRPKYAEALLNQYRELLADSSKFDWSHTHTILANIQPGQWTSYYNLAGAVGTSAQAVAGHISRCPDCANAYRVLTWDGKVADEFHWKDDCDTRNPLDVLQDEGVNFNGGMADPEQQLDVEDLLTLAGEDGP